MTKTKPTECLYIVAKYAKDTMRMEPRNIGVFVWARGRVAYRFLDDSDAAELVTDLPVFRRWKAFWSRIVEAGRVSNPRRPAVIVDDPSFLDELARTQKGNYILRDCERALIDVDNIHDAADFLFSELVEIRKPRPATQPRARRGK